MKRLSLVILIAALFANMSQASEVNLSATARGIETLSGAVSGFDTHDTWRVLLEQNNVLMPLSPGASDEFGYCDPFSGLAANNPHGVGFLANGPEDSYFALDRLSVVVVKQLLGFSHAHFAPPGRGPEDFTTPPFELGVPLAAVLGSQSVTSETPVVNIPVIPIVVPEPSSLSLLLLAIGAILCLGRPGNRPGHSPANPARNPNQSPLPA